MSPVGTQRPAGPKPLAQLPHVQAADPRPRPRRRGADARRLQHQAGLDPAQQVVQHPARLPRQAPHLSERVRVQPLQLLQKPEEEVLRDRRVLDRAVRTRVRDIHRARQRAERVLSKPRQEHVSQLPRVAPGRANGQAVVCEKSQVESEIVADEGRIADECGQSPGHGVERGRPVEVPLLDPGQALYEPADRPLRPGEALEGVQHPGSLELDRAHLYDLVRLGAQPGRLQVDSDPDVVHRRRCIREQHHASTPHPTFLDARPRRPLCNPLSLSQRHSGPRAGIQGPGPWIPAFTGMAISGAGSPWPCEGQIRGRNPAAFRSSFRPPSRNPGAGAVDSRVHGHDDQWCVDHPGLAKAK